MSKKDAPAKPRSADAEASKTATQAAKAASLASASDAPAAATDAARAARIEWLEHGLSAKDWGARLRELHPKRFFVQTWSALDEQAAEERQERAAAGKGYDMRPLIALCVGAVCLSMMEYFGHARTYRALLDWLDPTPYVRSDTFASWLRHSDWLELGQYCWWSGFRVVFYFLIPALIIKLAFKERLRDHGFETREIGNHAWIYGLSYAAVFVGIMFVAKFIPHFTEYYPFYDRSSRSWFDFFAWELLYAAQFLSLEFFFRGFWMRSMRSGLGSHAIWAMMVPYCMIHFGKPFVETLAAIFAGVALGTLALRTRSIWGGCVVHIGVAITMDVTALIVSGRGLPAQWFPG